MTTFLGFADQNVNIDPILYIKIFITQIKVHSTKELVHTF